MARVRWQRGRGAFFPLGESLTPEAIAERWGEIDNFDEPTYPETPTDSFAPVVANLQRQAKQSPTADNRPPTADASTKATPAVATSGAVSYTHLDVYKRQVRGWADALARG